MLALKKISTKKLAIYVFIIVLMLAGSGFMLYQNQNLTKRKSFAIDGSTRSDKFMTAEIAVPGGQAAPNQPLADPLKTEAEPSRPPAADKIKNNQAIDLTIFSSDKFKELKENVLIPQEDSGLGKRNPFQPD